MNDLSIFVDESGDFGRYEHHAPLYIVTLVFHEQHNDESENISRFEQSLSGMGLTNHIVHAGPLIRREEVYANMSVDERMKIFRRTFNFLRKTSITHKSFIVDKQQAQGSAQLEEVLSKQLERFLVEHQSYFMSFDRLILYYDNGQKELKRILVRVLNKHFNGVDQREVKPSAYRLQQVADMICTLELTSVKADRKILSKSEYSFFKSGRDLKKDYIKPLRVKEFKG